MLHYIPENCYKILDVGCASGEFGSLLKSKEKREVWGIELNQEAALAARNKLDKVLIGDVLELMDDIPQGYFDCIVFNDVLEHLDDPETVLLAVSALLSEEGHLVCSIPNVRYLMNLYELLIKKDWEYKEAGILDKTHLRFFTKKSIIRMFSSSAYRLKTIEGIQPLSKWKFQLVNIATLFMHQDMQYIQFAVVAQKK